MKLKSTSTKICLEGEILDQVLSFDNKNILELGCDKTQHQKNSQIDDLPNIEFVFAGSQNLPFKDGSFDVIVKSIERKGLKLVEQLFFSIQRVYKDFSEFEELTY